MRIMTDEELIDAYHEALCSYRLAKTGARAEAFVQFASAEVALISRFGVNDYLDHYGRRHTAA
jgi:hypothetical protein